MKKLISILIAAICCLFSVQAKARISQIAALAIAQRQFSGQDVDYYLVNNDSNDVWTIFVDADPLKGWEHDSYILSIPKVISTSIALYIPEKQYTTLPPEEEMTPMVSNNRTVNLTSQSPVVPSANAAQLNAGVANRTYAVILSGGYNKNANYERYWNDCSYVYQTLKRTYGVPQSNISVIMSDGTDPAADMRTFSGQYQSSPLDLDGDDIADIQYAATLANVRDVLSGLKDKLQRDDHLLFYVIDHGGTIDHESLSYINLWGTGILYDYILAEYLKPLTDNGVSVNVVLGQCYAGGFIDDLQNIGCVVSTACSGSESSYCCSNYFYDEFVYRWTSAINWKDTNGTAINADYNSDGKVTMDEAFLYAKTNDTQPETPQFYAGPESYGEYLAFTHLPLSNDVYVKDNPEDIGDEPNLTTTEFWKSPSIWVRNQKDGECEHENPEYSEDHQIAYVYVRVYNKGEKEAIRNKWIHVYWAQASTGLTPKAWRGRESYNDHQTGGSLESVLIDTIAPGGYKDYALKWLLPSMMEDYPEGNFHFCLYVKLMDEPTDEVYVEGVTTFDAKASNKEAQKNVTIIRKADVSKAFNVYVRNVNDATSQYSLELIPQETKDEAIFSVATVEMEMTPTVYSAWERGGCKSQDVQVEELGSNSTNTKVKLLSAKNKLKDLKMNSNEFDIVSIKFNFNLIELTNQTYYLDLVQKDEDGNIIGGETFCVESPTRTLTIIDIIDGSNDDGTIQLLVDDSGYSNLSWYDANGNILGAENTITITPTISNSEISVTGLTEDGSIATGSISIDSLVGINSVIQNSNNLEITLNRGALANSLIELMSYQNGTVEALSLVSEGEDSISLDISSLTSGLYVVRYIVNSTIVDTAKVLVNK